MFDCEKRGDSDGILSIQKRGEDSHAPEISLNQTSYHVPPNSFSPKFLNRKIPSARALRRGFPLSSSLFVALFARLNSIL